MTVPPKPLDWMADEELVGWLLEHPDDFEELAGLVCKHCNRNRSCERARAIRRLFACMFRMLGGDADEPVERHVPPAKPYPRRKKKQHPDSVAHLDWLLESEPVHHHFDGSLR